MFKVCTIITLSRLPQARVLSESFSACHPGERISVLLLDDTGGAFEAADEGFDLVRPEDLALYLTDFHRLAAIYSVAELTDALKPWLLRHIMDSGAEQAIFLDADVEVFADLLDIAGLATQHVIVLTPYSPQPIATDGYTPTEYDFLRAGAFDLSFLAVSGDARPFLEWWAERPGHEGEFPPVDGPDRWLDLIPAYFSHHVLRDPACNASFWTLPGHQLARVDSRYQVDGAQLRWFNFRDFSPRRPYLLSESQGPRPRVLLSENPDLQGLCNARAGRLIERGHEQSSDRPYGFDVAANGFKIDGQVKRTCRRYCRLAQSDRIAGDLEMPDPFDTRQARAFIDWLNSPTPRGPRRVSRFLLNLYEERCDIRIAFPNLWETDDERFLDWAARGGDVQHPVPPELAPQAQTQVKASSAGERPAAKPGFNIAGHMNTEIGIGEAARSMVAIMEAGGIPYSIVPPFEVLGCHEQSTFSSEGFGEADYNASILCVNPDRLSMLVDRLDADFFQNRHTIGYWAWEVDQFSEAMASSSRLLDEIWVYGPFVRDAIAPKVDIPVYCLPIPISVPEPQGFSRSDFDLPDDFMFFFSFAFTSMAERKNPWGVVEAFKRAFAPGQGPILVIKSVSGDNCVNEFERLKAAAAGRDDIIIMDAYLTREQQTGLMNLCDAYISLHRGEGFGLTMAEAMALGKPVIATGYSGNLEFMDAENSFLVPYELKTVPPGSDPYPDGSRWADPDLDAAAEYMRLVYSNPEEARKRGERAREDVINKHSAASRVAFVKGRLDEISKGSPRASGRRKLATGPTAAELASNYIASGPDFDAPSRFGKPARFLRKLSFRLIRHYDLHQRQAENALLEAIQDVDSRRESVAVSFSNLKAVTDSRIEELEQEIAALREEIRGSRE